MEDSEEIFSAVSDSDSQPSSVPLVESYSSSSPVPSIEPSYPQSPLIPSTEPSNPQPPSIPSIEPLDSCPPSVSSIKPSTDLQPPSVSSTEPSGPHPPSVSSIESSEPQPSFVSSVEPSYPQLSPIPSTEPSYLQPSPVEHLYLITECRQEFCSRENYLRGCKWSPDGTCLLTCSNDCKLRLFNLPDVLYSSTPTEQLPDMESVLSVTEGEIIYDYCWYPMMSSKDPSTCCFACSSRSAPVHLYDAYGDGYIRASYMPYNHLDELVSPHSIAFSADGSQLYTGFKNCVRIFDCSLPGKTCHNIPTYKSKGKSGQKGIISCIAASPTADRLFALGSYSCSVGLYSQEMSGPIFVFLGLLSGVSHISFSSCGQYLFSGERKSSELLCWDLRNPSRALIRLNREVTTNQRIYFDLDNKNRFLCSGNTNGFVTFWNFQSILTENGSESPTEPHHEHFPVHNDSVNGCSIHPWKPLLATTSGQWTFNTLNDDDDSADEEVSCSTLYENAVKIWNIDF